MGERARAWQGSKWCRPEKRLAIYHRDGFRCVWCDRHVREIALCLDHIVRVADGGGNEEANLVTSCFLCNQDREQIAPADWPVFLRAFWFRDEDVVARAVIRARSEKLDRAWAKGVIAENPPWLRALRARASKAFVSEFLPFDGYDYPHGPEGLREH